MDTPPPESDCPEGQRGSPDRGPGLRGSPDRASLRDQSAGRRPCAQNPRPQSPGLTLTPDPGDPKDPDSALPGRPPTPEPHGTPDRQPRAPGGHPRGGGAGSAGQFSPQALSVLLHPPPWGSLSAGKDSPKWGCAGWPGSKGNGATAGRTLGAHLGAGRQGEGRGGGEPVGHRVGGEGARKPGGL